MYRINATYLLLFLGCGLVLWGVKVCIDDVLLLALLGKLLVAVLIGEAILVLGPELVLAGLLLRHQRAHAVAARRARRQAAHRDGS